MRRLWPGGQRSQLASRILLRAALFALATFMLLALAELLFERASQRSSIHQKAVQATDLALPSIQLAVWAFDEPGLRLLGDSLLRNSAITRVQVKTPDGTMDLDLRRQDHAGGDGDSTSWSRTLYSQDKCDFIGTLTVSESLRQVDVETWRRAAYRIPVELLKVLGIVIGMTILTHAHVVSRLTSLASQLRSFRADDASERVTDIGCDPTAMTRSRRWRDRSTSCCGSGASFARRSSHANAPSPRAGRSPNCCRASAMNCARP